MRFNYKRKTYPAIKIGDVYFVRDKNFLKSECYRENKKLKCQVKTAKQIQLENEQLKEKLQIARSVITELQNEIKILRGGEK